MVFQVFKRFCLFLRGYKPFARVIRGFFAFPLYTLGSSLPIYKVWGHRGGIQSFRNPYIPERRLFSSYIRLWCPCITKGLQGVCVLFPFTRSRIRLGERLREKTIYRQPYAGAVPFLHQVSEGIYSPHQKFLYIVALLFTPLQSCVFAKLGVKQGNKAILPDWLAVKRFSEIAKPLYCGDVVFTPLFVRTI